VRDMKPLVYYCRWQRASLRLRGRDSTAVWGQLVQKTAEGKEKTSEFRYQLESAELIVNDGEQEYFYHLDEKGIPFSKDD
jgi:hypothetical protein